VISRPWRCGALSRFLDCPRVAEAEEVEAAVEVAAADGDFRSGGPALPSPTPLVACSPVCSAHWFGSTFAAPAARLPTRRPRRDLGGHRRYGHAGHAGHQPARAGSGPRPGAVLPHRPNRPAPVVVRPARAVHDQEWLGLATPGAAPRPGLARTDRHVA